MEQTEAKLGDYERKNRDAIAVNAAKRVGAMLYLQGGRAIAQYPQLTVTVP